MKLATVMREVVLVLIILAIFLVMHHDFRSLKYQILRDGLWATGWETREEVVSTVDPAEASDATIRALIFSLGDPALNIAQDVDHKLRLISRNEDGFGDLEQDNSAERLGIAKRWMQWYLNRHQDENQ